MRRLFEIVGDRRPVTLAPGATVQAACKHMHEQRFASVLVTDEQGLLLGIFTRRDAVRLLAEGADATKVTLGEAMTPNPATMAPDGTAVEALKLMWDGGFHHVPLTEGGKVVGIVSHTDFKGDEHQRLDEVRDLWEHLR